jgi:hypothetical protein
VVKHIFNQLGLVAAFTMPLWNIPLMMRVVRRKTSEDISLAWAFGVWGCILLMLPSVLLSPDVVLRIYGIGNAVFFTMVIIVVVLYRK